MNQKRFACIALVTINFILIITVILALIVNNRLSHDFELQMSNDVSEQNSDAIPEANKPSDVPHRTEPGLAANNASQPNVQNMSDHRFTGLREWVSLRKESIDGDFYIVDNWDFDSWARKSENIDVVNNTKIVIQRSGLYNVYSQLSWRMKKKGTASFELVKSNSENRWDVLAQCITSFAKDYAQLESCYTSVDIILKKGDQIFIAVFKEDLTLEFYNGRSTFGSALLNEMQVKK